MIFALVFAVVLAGTIGTIEGRIPADLCLPTEEDGQDLFAEAYRAWSAEQWTGHEVYVLTTEPKGSFPGLIGPSRDFKSRLETKRLNYYMPICCV